MLATDEDITSAELFSEFRYSIPNAAEIGITTDEHKEWIRRTQQAHDEAVQQAQQEALRQIRRETEDWWKEEREKIEAEVAAELDQDPAMRADAFLRKGTRPDGSPLEPGLTPTKLRRQEILDCFGADASKKLFGLWARDGAEIDDVAGLFGFDSGDSLVKALLARRNRQQQTRELTDARMREKYPRLHRRGPIEALPRTRRAPSRHSVSWPSSV